MSQAQMAIWQDVFSAGTRTEMFGRLTIEQWESMYATEQKELNQVNDMRAILTAEEELSLEAQTVDAELYAQARENEGFKWGER